MLKKTEFKIIFLIFLAGLIIKLGVASLIGSFAQPVTFEYEETAQNILAGKGFSNQVFGIEHYAYIEPFYPLFVAFFYKFTPFDKVGLIILQLFISTLLGVIIYLIAKDIFSCSVGIVACILTVFHPGLIIYSIKNLHPLIFDAFFLVLLILMLLELNRNPGIWPGIKAGGVLGLCILSRSTVILFIPLIFLWVIFTPHTKKTKFKSLAAITVISLLIITPWQVRNQMHFKKFVFISASKSQHFWRGNNIQASGTLWYGEKTYIEAMPEGIKNKISGKGELEQDKIFKDEALAFIYQHPVKFLQLWIKKFYYFWWFSPYAGKEYPAIWFNLYQLYYSIILINFVFGIANCLRNYLRKFDYSVFSKAILPILLMTAISLGQSLFYVEGRHRWEVEPLLLIFSAYTLVEMKNKILKN